MCPCWSFLQTGMAFFLQFFQAGIGNRHLMCGQFIEKGSDCRQKCAQDTAPQGGHQPDDSDVLEIHCPVTRLKGFHKNFHLHHVYIRGLHRKNIQDGFTYLIGREISGNHGYWIGDKLKRGEDGQVRFEDKGQKNRKWQLDSVNGQEAQNATGIKGGNR